MAKKPVSEKASVKARATESSCDAVGCTSIQALIPDVAFFLDVESLNVVASAALPSIGCVALDMARANPFDVAEEVLSCIADVPTADPDGDAISVVSSFYCTLDVTEQLVRHGRTMSTGTQRWWGVAHKKAVEAVTVNPCDSLDQSLRQIVDFMRIQMHKRTQNLSVADRKTAYENVKVYARGTHFDVAAVETLMFAVLGLLPATSAHTAFDEALWFYRSPRDTRSYVDGLKRGAKNYLTPDAFDQLSKSFDRNVKEMQKHINTQLANYTGDIDYLSGAAHHPVYDVFYDYLMVYYWQSPDQGEENTETA